MSAACLDEGVVLLGWVQVSSLDGARSVAASCKAWSGIELIATESSRWGINLLRADASFGARVQKLGRFPSQAVRRGGELERRDYLRDPWPRRHAGFLASSRIT